MTQSLIHIADKAFALTIPADRIAARVEQCAHSIEQDLNDGQDTVFIALLNGAFMFAADLVRRIHAPARLSFVKFASYAGTDSSGHVQELIGLTEDLAGKRVVIVEDIIDTGRTISHLLHSLRNRQPADIKIATLFYKPDSLQVPLHIDYFGFQIPNDFIVGYGMDYNGLGRNLPDIYTHVKSLIP